MTETHDFEPDDAPLPGLGPARAGQGSNEAAARRTIAALQTSQLVGEQHAVMLEALLTCARQLDRASTSTRSKDYGVANLIAQLRETYLALVPKDVEGGERSAWDQFLDELAGGSGSAAAVRDTP